MDEDPPADVKLPGKSKNDAKDTTSSLTVQVTKKLKTSEGGISVSTATAGPVRTKENSTKPPRNGNGNNGSSGRKSNTPFQRCNPDQVPADTVVDNRYEAKVSVAVVICFSLGNGHSVNPFRSLGQFVARISEVHSTDCIKCCRLDLVMITDSELTKILSSPAVQVSGKKRTRKREGATEAGRLR
jgi:hypothetical protein